MISAPNLQPTCTFICPVIHGFDMLYLTNRIRSATFTACTLIGLTLSACTDNDPQDTPVIELECGAHGALHGDHCHCDPGFSLTDDEMSCVTQLDQGETLDIGADMAEMQPDAGGDARIPDMGHGNDIPALQFAPASTRAMTGNGDDGSRIWSLEAMDDDVRMRLEIYEGFGGRTSPGVVEMTSAEASYATCGTCLILQTGCVAHGDHFDCERTFMPRVTGQLRLDAMGASAGDRFAGECLSLQFEEVVIDANFETRSVPNGAVLRLDSWAFDAPLEGLGGAEEECNGHGHQHGEQCHCDAGYRRDPEDSKQCIPE
ncbi:MAG: hypothetical protein ACI9U2_002551 [Bradymonadia bacterium]